MFYLFNIILTIYICLHGDLMYDNVSTIAYTTDLTYIIIVYTAISAIGFAYKTYKIYKLFHYKYIAITTSLTALLMIIGAFFPYVPNGEDIISMLHVYLSMICCLSFLIHLFVFNKKISIYYYDLYTKVHVVFDLGIEFIALCFLLFTRVNGYLEIIYSLLVCIYLYIVEKELKKITPVSSD